MTIEERIKQQEELVIGSISKCYAACCSQCEYNQKSQRHEIRRRTVYCQLEDRRAAAAQSWLVRWRCFNCGTRFTAYPLFALPYKRHVTPAIFEMATEMFRERAASYRSAAGSQAGHSSFWRWLEWLSGLHEQRQRLPEIHYHCGSEQHSASQRLFRGPMQIAVEVSSIYSLNLVPNTRPHHGPRTLGSGDIFPEFGTRPRQRMTPYGRQTKPLS